ncbi:hypothetical protein TWF694_009963 [Orbilia ellipsospora]|uniref:Uncharacterized protein n=1 Tax=Orbilia ellipsospora TaxID=2528407 RepID=A0AAV9XCF3_9PEZI
MAGSNRKGERQVPAESLQPRRTFVFRGQKAKEVLVPATRIYAWKETDNQLLVMEVKGHRGTRNPGWWEKEASNPLVHRVGAKGVSNASTFFSFAGTI